MSPPLAAATRSFPSKRSLMAFRGSRPRRILGELPDGVPAFPGLSVPVPPPTPSGGVRDARTRALRGVR